MSRLPFNNDDCVAMFVNCYDERKHFIGMICDTFAPKESVNNAIKLAKSRAIDKMPASVYVSFFPYKEGMNMAYNCHTPLIKV